MPYDVDGVRTPSKVITKANLDSLNVYGTFSGVKRSLRCIAANSSTVWLFYQNENEDFMRVKIRNNNSNLSPKVINPNNLPLNFGAGTNSSYFARAKYKERVDG